MVSEKALLYLSGAKTRQHSMLENDEKDKAVVLWTKRWEGFLEYVVAEGRKYVQNKENCGIFLVQALARGRE